MRGWHSRRLVVAIVKISTLYYVYEVGRCQAYTVADASTDDIDSLLAEVLRQAIWTFEQNRIQAQDRRLAEVRSQDAVLDQSRGNIFRKHLDQCPKQLRVRDGLRVIALRVRVDQTQDSCPTGLIHV